MGLLKRMKFEGMKGFRKFSNKKDKKEIKDLSGNTTDVRMGPKMGERLNLKQFKDIKK